MQAAVADLKPTLTKSMPNGRRSTLKQAPKHNLKYSALVESRIKDEKVNWNFEKSAYPCADKCFGDSPGKAYRHTNE